MVNPILELKNLTKSYVKELPVLENINFTLDAGKIVCILGISGSGKTTMMNIISGLDKASSGTVKLCGRDLDEISDEEIRTRYVSIIFQKFELLHHMTAIDNVIAARTFVSDNYEENLKLANNLLQEMEMGEHLYKYPDQLSGGQQQRVGIARAIINEPSLILADEPSGSLDKRNSDHVMEILTSLVNEERSIIFSTHDLEIAEYADEIYILKNHNLERLSHEQIRETKKIRSLYI